ncbi:MAG: FecR domain-containing protein [Cellvibrionaceae bacterium]|nr:FecR domain-containing protein [Cellvibrionaceae bacterium]
MGDILKFARRRSNRDEKILEQSSLWIAKLSRGLTSEETAQLQGWLRDQQCRDVLFKMAKIWDQMDALQGLTDVFPLPEKITSNPALNSNESKNSALAAKKSSLYNRSCVSTYALPTAVAAMVMVIVASVFFLGTHKPDITFSQTYATTKGQTSSIYLNDGSNLILNTNGRVHVRYSNQERLLQLERGELSIHVAHDASRPLSVITSQSVVQAVGTAFNVNLRDNQEVEVIVTDGVVRVKERSPSDEGRPVGRLPEAAMTVTKGEKVTLNRRKETAVKLDDADLAVALGWRQGNLIFRGETLEEALTEVSRYTHVRFEIADDDIRKKQIAGRFKIGDIQGLLSVLDKNFQIRAEWTGDNKIVLSAF